MTRDEFYSSDRGERKYYQAKSDLKNRVKLPVTTDGCEALLEIVTKALDIPFDETTRQVFAGFVHHLPMGQNWTTLDELGKYLHRNLSNGVTWKFDQDSKEREKALKETPALTIAKDANGEVETTTKTVQ